MLRSCFVNKSGRLEINIAKLIYQKLDLLGEQKDEWMGYSTHDHSPSESLQKNDKKEFERIDTGSH